MATSNVPLSLRSRFRAMRSEWMWRLYGRLSYSYIFMTSSSLRWIIVNRRFQDELAASGRQYIYAFWHGKQFPLVYIHRGQPAKILVSKSRDGEFIHRPLHCAGLDTVRGSTSRGGTEAYQELLQVLLSGELAAITPDGPRGPRCTVAPGVIALARRADAPILPITSAASSAWHLHSWDQFMVPKPFATLVVAYGKPVRVPGNLPEDQFGIYQQILQEELDGLTAAAEKIASGRACNDVQITRTPGRGSKTIPSRALVK